MKKISFCGISGSGVCGLAQIMALKGFEVRGSDRSFDQGHDLHTKKALEEIGIKIFPQDGSSISDDLDVLYTSTAVEDTIADIKAAKEKNIPIKTRPDLLAKLFHQYPYNIAVSGTSGKTTTTAMVGFILDKLNKKPCVINGGLLINYMQQKGIPNIIFNQGDVCVIEADESNGTIDKYNPYIGLINNIGEDHKSLDELKTLFQNFANRCVYGLVVNADCPNSKEIRNPKIKNISFSIKNPQADFYASDIQAKADGVSYMFRGKEFNLKLIGDFNVANAMAAIATCSLLGVNAFDAARVLEDFLGTKRRLEVVGCAKNITVIDDFAHNPDKVSASVSALRNYEGRLIIMFQPHGFAPMKQFGKDIMKSFATHMNKDDILILPDIYFAGGTVNRTISSQDLVKDAQEFGTKAFYLPTREEVKNFIMKNAQPFDRIVIMGARDNTLTDFCQVLLKEIENVAA